MISLGTGKQNSQKSKKSTIEITSLGIDTKTKQRKCISQKFNLAVIKKILGKTKPREKYDQNVKSEHT